MAIITAQHIADFLGGSLSGPNIHLSGVSSFRQPKPGTMVFVQKGQSDVEQIVPNILYLVTKRHDADISQIVVDHPKLAFARACAHFFIDQPVASISETAQIAQSARIGQGVSIGHGVVIGEQVVIGDDTRIQHHVVIADGCRIGRNGLIKSGTVIGEPGFGFAFDQDRTPVRVPHIGAVDIGDRVEVGAQCTIASGTIEPTVIEADVKIDDQVHISHNCRIGAKSIITACVEISGSVKIGPCCWLGPNAAIMNQVEIGQGSRVGLGAVISDDMPVGAKYMGIAAMPLKRLAKWRRWFGKI